MNLLKEIAFLLARFWWNQNPKSSNMDVRSSYWVFNEIVLGHDIVVRVDLVKQEPIEKPLETVNWEPIEVTNEVLVGAAEYA